MLEDKARVISLADMSRPIEFRVRVINMLARVPGDHRG